MRAQLNIAVLTESYIYFVGRDVGDNILEH